MFCAGPKNGSGRLWAIMMRSRTSTAYMGRSPKEVRRMDNGSPGPGPRVEARMRGSSAGAASKAISSLTS